MRLLIIDDDDVDRLAVVRALDAAGGDVTVDQAATATAGLAMLWSRHYDCVLVDYLLPASDGLQVLQQIRRAGMRTPVIVLTGQGDEELAVELMKAGAADYLSKQSLAPNRLARSLRYAIEMAQSEAARHEAMQREQAAHEEAQAANLAKDQFLAMLSHELRTPLNAIMGWARLLSGGTLDAANSARAVEIIERNARRQAQLIEDLLDISRIAVGNLRLEMRESFLAAIIDGAVEAVRPAAEAKEITIDTRLRHAARPVFCDAARIEQVVWNLLSNAIKFTPQGGRVTVDVEDRGECFVLRVADNGTGISPEFLPRVFERFRQAENPECRTRHGLGIGLSIARHLVELHGGSISVESEGEGRGATFTVALPVARAKAATSSPALQNRLS